MMPQNGIAASTLVKESAEQQASETLSSQNLSSGTVQSASNSNSNSNNSPSISHKPLSTPLSAAAQSSSPNNPNNQPRSSQKQKKGRNRRRNKQFEDFNHNTVARKPLDLNLGPMPSDPSRLTFHCQLSTGSPTGLITGFKSIKELYAKIAECYDIDTNQVLYCTLNTHKIDMSRMLAGQIGLNDFIFAHIKGIKKEVEMVKSEAKLGITISDNGQGKSFIKRLAPNSVVSACEPAVAVGDHIEKLNGESLVGKKHYEVASALKAIPVGSKFTLRLIEPQKSHIGPRTSRSSGRSPMKSGNLNEDDGMKTLRFKGGKAVVEDITDTETVKKMNKLLEDYLGVSDDALALTILEEGKECNSPSALAEVMEAGELGSLGIPQELIFDVFGIISDWRRGDSGQLSPSTNNVLSAASPKNDVQNSF